MDHVLVYLQEYKKYQLRLVITVLNRLEDFDAMVKLMKNLLVQQGFLCFRGIVRRNGWKMNDEFTTTGQLTRVPNRQLRRKSGVLAAPVMQRVLNRDTHGTV